MTSNGSVMAPILYCRCSNCVCKATVLLNQVMEDKQESVTDESDKDRVAVMVEEYVEHNVSNKDDIELMSPSPEESPSSEPGLESLLSLLLLVLVLICESNKASQTLLHLIVGSIKIYSNVNKTLMRGKTSSFRVTKELGEVEVGLSCFVKKTEEKRNKDGYFEDDLSRLLHSLREAEERNMGKLSHHRVNKPGYASMPALVHIL